MHSHVQKMEQRQEISNNKPDLQPKLPYQGIFLRVLVLGIDEIDLVKPGKKEIKEGIQEQTEKQQTKEKQEIVQTYRTETS